MKNMPAIEQTTSAESEAQSQARGSERWLKLARVVWVFAALIAGGIFIASMPAYLSGLVPTPRTVAAPPEVVGAINRANDIASLLCVCISLFLAALLFFRQWHERMAVFVSFYLLAYGIIVGGPLERVEAAFHHQFLFSVNAQTIIFTTPTLALFYLFPSGHLVPRWLRWPALCSLLLIPMTLFLSPSELTAFNTPATWFFTLVLLSLFMVGIYAQIYRYRYASSPAERQQTKLVTFGLFLWSSLIILTGAVYIYVNNLPPGMPQPLWIHLSGLVWAFSLSILPLSMALAILRYGLWDIDLIINRTLVYLPLTALVAGIFAASIALSQRFFFALTGQSSDAATGFATLVTVAAFEPLKTRLQTFVDKRFREVPDPIKRLKALNSQIRSYLQLADRSEMTRHALNEAVASFEATGGAVYLNQNGNARVAYATENWKGSATISVPFERDGSLSGRIELGARKNGAEYGDADRALLQETADLIVHALALNAQLEGTEK